DRLAGGSLGAGAQQSVERPGAQHGEERAYDGHEHRRCDPTDPSAGGGGLLLVHGSPPSRRGRGATERPAATPVPASMTQRSRPMADDVTVTATSDRSAERTLAGRLAQSGITRGVLALCLL